MRGFVVMAMLAVSMSHAGSHNYSEVRNLELDASGLSDLFIDAGAGALVVNGVEGSDEIVVVATIVVGDGDADEARKLIEKRLRLELERDGDSARLKAGFRSGWGWDGDAAIDLDVRMPAQLALLIDDGSGSITVLDLASGKRVRNIPTGDGAEGLAVAPGTRQIWVTNRGADTVTVLDGETFEVVREIESTGFPIRATATPAGHVLVTRARAGDLVIYDAGTFETVRTIAFEIGTMDVEERLFGDRFGDSSVPIGVIADPAAERAFVAHANADVITEIDLASGEILRILRAGREPDGMGYSSLSVAGPESG